MKQSITQKTLSRARYLLFLCVFLLSTLNGFADHFRYGSLTWQRVPGNPLAVKFTLRNAFRLSLWTDQNLPVTIGSTIQTANFKPGQGANIPAIYTVTAINTKDDWWYGECTAIKTYTSSDTFAAFYNVCCRILNLQNNANATTVVPSIVQVGTFNDNNDAPVVVTAPIVNFPRNKSFVSLKIPAIDPNGDAVTFSLAPVGTFGLPSTHPVGMVISNDGWLSWNTIGKNKGDLYNTSIKVTDSKGAYVYVDFLIKVVDTSSPPSFDYVNSPADGSTFNIQPGQNITFNIKVSDPTTGDTVSLYAIGLPPGSGLTTTGTNPVDGTFGWTPTPDQQGTYVVTFISEDKFGVQNTTTVNFNVGYKPYFDIPTTPGNNSIFSVKPGDTLAHIIKAISPDTAAKVGLTMVSGFTTGMAFTPAFPLVPTNPVSTNFKWVPQMSDWGTRMVVYKAVDTFRKQPVYDTIHYVIDNPPVITSTPDTTVIAGNTYTYILSATDVDIPLGDKLKVENITLPSFLSIVSNNNNTWTISGTPGVGDVGIHNIMIEVADSMNHKFGTHDGNAYQYIPLHVNYVPLNATATVSNATIYNTNTGGINLTPTGGVGPYTYVWSNSAITEDLTNIPAGTYTVTITDANNTTFTATYTVTQPAQLTVSGTTTDVTIFGGNNGAINITPAGGVGPYTYVWSNTSTNEDLTGLTAGTYGVTVTDANGAIATGSFTINQPAQLTATAVVTPATIHGTNTGSIDITPAGGVGPYTYHWSNNATTEDLTGVGAGTYTVTITDANGATFTGIYTVTEPAVLTVAGITTDVTIFGGYNGAINITAAGGVGPYTYVWSNTSTNEDITNLTAGTYGVIVTDANGATATGSFTINQPAQLTVSGTTTDVTIFGGNNGAINITPAGGVGPYTYVWSNTSTNEDLTGLTAGTYGITVTDANGAIATGSFTINQPAQLTATAVVTPATIHGTNTGSINITPAGGVGPYTYHWSNNTTTEDLTGVGAGTYTVTITDVNGATFTGTYTVTEPALLTVAGITTDVTIFGGSNGAINITAAGGVGPYTYLWNNNSAAEDRTGLTAGTYSVTVTDANGATAIGTFTVNQPAQLTAIAVVTPATIYGTNTGSINITPAGGVGPYTYHWSNNATTEDLTGVGAGTYTVTITDANGATFTGTYTVTQPAALTVTGVTTNVSIFGGNNGAINITAAGGVGPYTYLWNNNSTIEDRTGLTAGTYTVTVTDANGAIATGTFTITQPTQLTVAGVTTNVTIFGGNNGSINITPAGGVGPYTYLWNNNSTIEDRTGLTAGTYSVTVKDANNATATATFTITQPTQVTVTGVVTNVTTNGGSNGAINITAAGGVGPYTYLWNNNSTVEDRTGLTAGTYSVTVKDANNATATATFTVTQPTVQLTAAIAVSPVYTVPGHAAYTIYQGYGAQSVTLTASAIGGTPGYTYSWSPTTGVASPNSAVTSVTPTATTTYTVTVKDANNNTATVSRTIYVIDVRCGNGNGNNQKVNVCHRDLSCNSNHVHYGTCYGYHTICISVNALSTHLAHGDYLGECMDAYATTTNASCNGNNNGAIDLTMTGSGAAPFTYSWSNNATTEDISGLTTGTYTVTINSADGRSLTKSFTVGQPSAITATAVVSNACYNSNNGSINLTVSGGSSPYTYLWNNNSTSQDRSNLSAGTYSVVITDHNGCSVTKSFTVIQPTSALTLNAALTHVSCNGGDNGAIDLSVNGGAGPYTYSWNLGSSNTNNNNCWNWWSWWCNNNNCNNNNNTNTNTQDVNGLEEGNYSVTVTDANGCTATASYTLTEPTVIALAVTKTNVTCKDGNNGTITLNVTGGTAPYSYNWGGNVTTQNRSGLAAGTYNVTVTDAKGCTKATSVSISQPSNGMSASGVVANATCNGNSNGGINLTVSGGTSPYTYSWTGGATTQDISNKPAGTYTVVISDAGGCSTSKTFTIGQPTAISLTATTTNNMCYGEDDGSINISVTGGTSPYSYKWNNNATCQDRSGLTAGTYSVIVTDANGCTTNGSYTITQPTSAIAVTAVVTNATCNNANNGSINVTVAGGTSPYTYSWTTGTNWCNNNNVTTQDRSNLDAGTYTVKVTDAKGCTKTVSFTVTEPTTISSSISVSPAVTVTNGQSYTIYKGFGAQSVTMSASASGGNGGYSYQWSPTTGVANPASASTAVTPNATTTYTVTITDSKGCSKTVSKTITVIDVRCGSNNEKVEVCRNGNKSCITQSQVQSYLNNGYNLGDCDDDDHNHCKPGATNDVSDIVGKDIKVYPNPSNGMFMLELPAGVMNANVIITDMGGKLIEHRIATGVNSISFDLSRAAQGVYMMQVTAGNEKYQSRITIQ